MNRSLNLGKQNQYREIYLEVHRRMVACGLERESLAAMARALQHELLCPSDTISNAKPLEVIMRAVTAVLEGDPESANYIKEKLILGGNDLLNDLPNTD